MKTLDTMNIFHVQRICNIKRIYRQVVIYKNLVKDSIWMPNVLMLFETFQNLLVYQ